jgi:hypothetical protein
MLFNEGIITLSPPSRPSRMMPLISVVDQERGLVPYKSLGGTLTARRQIIQVLIGHGMAPSPLSWHGVWAGKYIYMSNGPRELLRCNVNGAGHIMTTQGRDQVFVDPLHSHPKWSAGGVSPEVLPYVSTEAGEALFDYPANNTLALYIDPKRQHLIWRGWLLLAATGYPNLPPLVVRGTGEVGTNIARVAAAVLGVPQASRHFNGRNRRSRGPNVICANREGVSIPRADEPLFANVAYTARLSGPPPIVLWSNDAMVAPLSPKQIENDIPGIIGGLADDLLTALPLSQQLTHRPYWAIYLERLMATKGGVNPRGAARTTTRLMSQVGRALS